MINHQNVVILFLVSSLVFLGGCSYFGFGQADLPPPTEVVTATPSATPAETATAVVEVEATDEPEPPAEVVVESTEVMTPTNVLTSASDLASEPAPIIERETVAFTANLGLVTFSAYRLNVSAVFSGTRQGQPAAGSLEGLFEVTRNPEARHWRIEMAGDIVQEFASLGQTVELYDINGFIYMQNPQDGSWLGMPGFVVKGLIPQEIYTPEDHIRLPATVELLPGEEVFNGVATRRYTFGPQDIVVEGATYDHIEGTIWVALQGDYIVRYEATVSSRQEKLTAGGIELLDSGVVTVVYEVSDVNGAFTISPPAGATGGLFFR